MSKIIDGKLVSSELRKQISAEVADLKSKGINPGLAVILVGNNPASAVYVRNKERACIETGIEPTQITLPEETTESELIELIEKLAREHTLSLEEYEYIIINRDADAIEKARELAVSVRREHYGNSVYIRGLIEISNICKNDCLYCGIRRSNHDCDRYRLTKEQILAAGWNMPVRDFVPDTIEEQLICFADKFYSKTKFLHQARTLEQVVESMAKISPQAVEKVKEWAKMFL